nr:thioesterase domain-containing protein [Nocardiopsis algeriensis]
MTRIRPVQEGFRLFLLHHAGGSPANYRPWVRHFPADWDVCLVGAPGRDAGTEPLREARELARHLYEHIAPGTDRPHGLFGHSMGALLAYEMALLAAERGAPGPDWLGVSAWSPAPGPEWDRPRHLLPSEQLCESVARSGAPAGALDDPDRWRRTEPLVRADLEVVDTWRPHPGTPPLRTPLSVLGGAADPGMPPERMDAWHGYTEGPVLRHTFPGGHFYFMGRVGEVVAHVTADVAAALGTAR